MLVACMVNPIICMYVVPDVLWESTHVFVAAYWNEQEGEQPTLVIITCSVSR